MANNISNDDEYKRKRICLELSKKVEILNRLDAGERPSKIKEEFNIGKSTLYTIKSSKDIILQRANNNGEKEKDKKLFRPPKSPYLEAKLYEWISKKHLEDILITGPDISEKAKSLNEELNLNLDCKFSSTWVQSFKERHKIAKLCIAKENSSAECDATETFSLSSLKKEELTDDDEIWVETGLNVKNPQGNTIAGNDEESASKFNHSKERQTVLSCSDLKLMNSDNQLELTNTVNNSVCISESSIKFENKTNQQQDSEDMCDFDESWSEVEKAIDKVLSFMENKPSFSYDDCNDARRVKTCLLIKKFEEQEQNELHKKLEMTEEKKIILHTPVT